MNNRLWLSAFAVICFSGRAWAESQTLEKAMAQAYQTNPALQSERAKLRAVDEQVSQALSGWRPSIDATGAVGSSYQNSPLPPKEYKTLTPQSLGAQVTQPLFRGFRTVSAVRAAEAQVNAQRALLKDAEQKLLLDVGEAFLDVVQGQAVLDLTRGNEEVYRQQLASTNDRFKIGEVTHTDVSQSDSRLQRATAARIQAEGDLANKRATYARLVGDMPGTLEQPVLNLSDIRDIDEAVSRAEKNNPIVQATMHSQESAKEQVAYSKGSLLPELNLVGGVSRAWEQNAMFPDRQDSASVIAQVTVPLYRSGADYSRTRAAQQTVTQYRLQLEDARHRAREAAISAWQSLITARAAVSSNKAGIEAADMALKGVIQEANVGTRTTLDVLNAEQELLDAKVALVKAERNESSAVLYTKAAVGELTAEAQKLPVKIYDARKNYDAVRDKWVGFGTAED